MEFIKVKTYEELSRLTAEMIIDQINEKPDSVLGLATGSTPIGTYKHLIDAYKKGDVDFASVKSVNLDEYCGISEDNDQSYRYFMNTNLFDSINIDKANTYVPCGMAEDYEAEAKRYDGVIAQVGPIDVQILGIGNNGHIGFNEPAESFSEGTNVVNLTETTINANSRFFERIEDVPTKAITMGVKSIMDAKKIILIASGQGKKEIVEKAVYGEVTPMVPASILQKHGNVTVIFSEE
ncbi:MAG: glucosamine-6-phosphate deaminase [Clostridia bacterium]|nr:glucosamine-6-phosphate deaminase [Clostridia bacterium]